jgi:hypothetical protein
LSAFWCWCTRQSLAHLELIAESVEVIRVAEVAANSQSMQLLDLCWLSKVVANLFEEYSEPLTLLALKALFACFWFFREESQLLEEQLVAQGSLHHFSRVDESG